MDTYQRFADFTKSGAQYPSKAPSDVVYGLAALAGEYDVEASYVRYTSQGRETTWFGLWLVPPGLIHVSATYNEPNWTANRESNGGSRPPSAFTSWYRRVGDVKAIGINSIEGVADGPGKQVVLHGQATLELVGVPQKLTITFGEPGSGGSELLAKLRDHL